uniref:Ig-like domain-containing protein n=1 Tax=Anopheles culicifacies TaxID=139723 RepID=A0A182LYD1_9DIPT
MKGQRDGWLLNIISGEVQSYWEQPFAQPYFDNSTKREVTATVGQSALLHCRVRNLGDRAVSWIRKRDLHILTVGILTYTNDQRFQSLHTEGSDEWTLRITSPQPRDSGTYECQARHYMAITVFRSHPTGGHENRQISTQVVRIVPDPHTIVHRHVGLYTLYCGIQQLGNSATRRYALRQIKASDSRDFNSPHPACGADTLRRSLVSSQSAPDIAPVVAGVDNGII